MRTKSATVPKPALSRLIDQAGTIGTSNNGDPTGNVRSVPPEEIRLRAYQKWEAAGRPEGNGINFWVEAERELLQGHPIGTHSQGSHRRVQPEGKPAMRGAKHKFDVELRGETAIVTPVGNLRELDCLDIEAGQKEVLAFLDHTHARNVVLDLSRMDYSGSTALGFFIRLSTRVKGGGGRMAVCNVSKHEQEIFRLAHFDRLWPVFHSTEEALQAVAA